MISYSRILSEIELGFLDIYDIFDIKDVLAIFDGHTLPLSSCPVASTSSMGLLLVLQTIATIPLKRTILSYGHGQTDGQTAALLNAPIWWRSIKPRNGRPRFLAGVAIPQVRSLALLTNVVRSICY